MKAIAVTVLLTALLNACFAEIDDDSLDTATTLSVPGGGDGG